MKYLILFLLLFIISFNSIGQASEEKMKQMAFENPFHSSHQQYLTISNYTNHELEEFLKYDWTSAEIKSKENEVMILDSVNFFLPDQKMIFLNDGKMMELFPERIEKIKIENTLFESFYVDDDKERQLKFFEVLAGSDFKVLKTTKVTEEAKRIHSMGIKSSETKLVSRDRYFYVSEATNLAIPIPGSKAKFLKAFRKHRKKMIKFLEKRQLSPRKETDLIVIARYYNMLIREI